MASLLRLLHGADREFVCFCGELRIAHPRDDKDQVVISGYDPLVGERHGQQSNVRLPLAREAVLRGKAAPCAGLTLNRVHV